MLSSLLLASTLAWSPSIDDALARAKAEKKVVLVHLRASSERANREADATLVRAEANENIALMLESFVLARTTESLPGSRIVAPALAALDPDGRLVFTVQVRNEKEIGRMLGPLRDHSRELLRSWEVRSTASQAAADMILGRVIANLGHGRRAIEVLSAAAKKLRAEGDEGTALYADLWTGVAFYTIHDRQRAWKMIDWVAHRKRAPPLVVAEAWAFIGDMHMAERRKDRAIEAYRTAYEMAPAGSPALRVARRALETYDTQPLPPKGEVRSAALRLIAPARRAMTGRAQFIAEADPSVARVELFLDDVPVASADKRPFRFTIDVGPVAIMRSVKAVGFDDSGNRVGEAFAAVNDRVDAFRVSISAPVETYVRGAAEIQAEVQVPPTRKLERLELYWKEELLATLTAPPFRHTFEFPAAFGYLRAVGVLDDGSTTEDARIVNSEGASETVDVRAVVLLATVTDASGKRVEGLTEQDFVIQDEGKPVEATVRHATDTPVTIGVAIDSSSSMKTWLFEALETATAFVRSGEGTADRTFVTSFDESPRLVHETSTDVGSLRRRILEIRAAGGTSIFDGVIFALQQFQSLSGRKALLVISDGREGLSTQSASSAIRTARAAAIPIYAIGPPSQFGQALPALSEATGGVSFAPRKEELPAIFARIRDDVRGQYMISFAPQRVKAGTWRDVRVTTRRPDLRVRTVSGYYAR